MSKRLFTDTTNFSSIDCGDVIEIDSRRYLVTGHEREGRFGIDDPKLWVKRVVDSETDEKKIIKLSFFESFETSLGGVKIKCFRNPKKEGDILNLVHDHPYFMHGTSHTDSHENHVRILKIVQGSTFLSYIGSIDMAYGEYVEKLLPQILRNLIKAFESIRFLHNHGFKHGDIRNDHLIVENNTGNYVWIDFDYDYDTRENPFGLDIFGLSSILLYAIGKGFHNLHMIKGDFSRYGDLIDRVEPEDFCILHKGRLMNLKKVYPDIPGQLNDILIHFTKGSEIFYETAEELIEDLNRYLYSTLY